MSRFDHPSYGGDYFRVVCSDGLVIADDIPTFDEAVLTAQQLDCSDAHMETCWAGHVVEMFAGWVPVTTTRARA